MSFGEYVRTAREKRRSTDPSFSLRQLSHRLGVQPSYLSKIESGAFNPPSEAVIVALARELGENPHKLLAMAGKVSRELLELILERPELIAELLNSVRHVSNQTVSDMSRKVRDGDW